MKAVKAEDAVGKRLVHDYTCIDLGFKGAIKRRGEQVMPPDVEVLKKCGHYYVYVEEGHSPSSSYVHEVEAVTWLAKLITGDNLKVEAANEGKAIIYASTRGLLLVNSRGLSELNSTGIFVVVTKKNGAMVEQGDLVSVVDLVPLFVEARVLEELKLKILGYLPLIRVVEAKKPKIAILVTGNEIIDGLRKDLASPVVAAKLGKYGCELGKVEYARDDLLEISGKIEALLREHDGVVVTGGMSVDPTDYTPRAISLVADHVVAYGIPIKPTTMSMVAYRDGKPIIGVPAGIIHFPEENVLDIVLPWVSAGVEIPRDYLVSLGEGGLMESFLKRKRGE